MKKKKAAPKKAKPIRDTELFKLRAAYDTYISLTASRPTAVRYSHALEAFFKRFRDKEDPEEFTRKDIEDYRIWRLREGRNPATVNYEVRIIGSFWTWLMSMDRVKWNPAKQVKKLKEKEAAKRSLSLVEQESLIKGCFCWGDRALVALALTTGLRGETLAALETKDIDFEGRRLVVPAEKMKAGRNHEIPLPDWTLTILRDSPPNERILAGYARNADSVGYRWNCVCRRAGINARGIRLARRTFATTLLRGGADLKLVQDLLGHRNIVTTSRYLTPADSDTARAAVDRIPRIIDCTQEQT